MSKSCDSGERIIRIKDSSNTAKYIWREMKPRESDIKRVAKDYIPCYRRSEKINGNLIKKLPSTEKLRYRSGKY